MSVLSKPYFHNEKAAFDYKAKNAKRGAPIPRKEPVVALVEREGRVRSFHLPEVNAQTLRPILVTQIQRKSGIMAQTPPFASRPDG